MTTTRRLALATPLLALVLAGCSGTTSSAPASGASHSGGKGGAHRRSVVSGQISSVSGTTLQVQEKGNNQAAVTVTQTTTVTQQQAGTAADVTQGSCVSVVAATPAPAAVLNATSVLVSAPVNAACPPAGRGGALAGKRALLTGQVTTVQGSTVIVQGALRSGGGHRTSGSGGTSGGTATKPSGPPATIAVTVVLASTTRYGSQAKVSSSILASGQCITAWGSTGTTGAITATNIAIGPTAANGTCGGKGGGTPTPSPTGGTNG